MHYYIGIDPSINHTGWAMVQFKTPDDGFPLLLGSGVFKHTPSEGDERIAAAFWDVWRALKRCMDGLPLSTREVAARTVAIIEKPHFESKRKSKHIFSLVEAAGACVAGVAAHGIPWAFITASQWKRDLPKYKIKWRVEQLFPEKKDKWAREDEYEACGLALWGNALKGTYEVYNKQEGTPHGS